MYVVVHVAGFIGASMSEPHIDELNMKKSVCMSVCLSVSLTQIVLTPIATLYDNGFTDRVQNSSRAFNYPCSGCALARNQTAESQVKALGARQPQLCGTMSQQA